MGPKDRERQIEEWLDSALKEYGEAEPRAGLEGRVLANLRAVDEHLSEPGRWWPALVAVAAMLSIGAAIFIVREHRGNATEIAAVHPPVSHAPQGLTELTHAPDAAVMPRASKHRRFAGLQRLEQEAKANAPRLEQFPSPQPLSEQEKILARYVAELPSEAKQMAQAQTEIERQDQIEFEKLGQLESPSGDSSQ